MRFDTLMVDLNDLVIFDPASSTLYSAKELQMSMNGRSLQITLPSSLADRDETPSPPVKKRSRSARAADKKLSRAFKDANARYRKKDGSLRAGRTQADIARLAHKLRKKM